MELLPCAPAWLPLQLSHALVVPMLLLAAAHLSLTKTDLQLGLARLREKFQQRKQPLSQGELDRARRFEEELLRVRLEMFQRAHLFALHFLFAYSLAMVLNLMMDPSLASLMQLISPLVGYATHVSVQAGFVQFKTKNHFRVVQGIAVVCYTTFLYGVANEQEYERFCAAERIAGTILMLLCVLLIDMHGTLPISILSSAVVTFKRWQWMGFSNATPELVWSTLVSHATVTWMVFWVSHALQSSIARKLESDDASSLLLASRHVLKGVCDGDLVLDRRSHLIVEDASPLERLLHAREKLSGRNFLDLLLDADGRQRFLHFLQSEAAPKASKAAIPPCLRIALQGADGPVSTDVFCTSCAAAGKDYYLLAFRADPDQVLAPPDAPLGAFEVTRQGSEGRQRQRSEGPGSSSEVAEAFNELVQVTLIVSNDNPRMDIEEASLSFCRSRQSRGMPTLRNFIPINHWERVVEFFRSAKDNEKQVLRFPSPLVFCIPGSKPRNYIRARSATVGVVEEEDGQPRTYELQLSAFDLTHLRRAREQDLESIGEDAE